MRWFVQSKTNSGLNPHLEHNAWTINNNSLTAAVSRLWVIGWTTVWRGSRTACDRLCKIIHFLKMSSGFFLWFKLNWIMKERKAEVVYGTSELLAELNLHGLSLMLLCRRVEVRQGRPKLPAAILIYRFWRWCTIALFFWKAKKLKPFFFLNEDVSFGWTAFLKIQLLVSSAARRGHKDWDSSFHLSFTPECLCFLIMFRKRPTLAPHSHEDKVLL